MAPKLLHYIRKLFRTGWRGHVPYGNTLSRRRRNTCVLKSVSSKSSLSAASSAFSEPPNHSCSMDSINFAFRTAEDIPDLCCARKCCKKCFCEEGEALAEHLRKTRIAGSTKLLKKSCKNCSTSEKKGICSKKKCYCSDNQGSSCCKKCCCPTTSQRSLDSACDITSASSCEDADCQFRNGSVAVKDFISIQAAALANVDYETLTPQYENVPPSEPPYDNVQISSEQTNKEESPYDFVPPRTPRAVTMEPKYENVLNINCVNECVFREISALMENTKTHSQVVESLQELHKNYSCVRRTSSADNEINYFYEDYEDLENDLNTEIERRLSD